MLKHSIKQKSGPHTTQKSLHVRPIFAVLICTICVLLVGCGGGGGGGGSAPPPEPPPPPPPPTGNTPTTDTSDCSVTVAEAPFEKVWPGQMWETRTHESQGLCPDNLNDAVSYAFVPANSTGAVLVIKNGYLVLERYSHNRTREDLVTSWSVGKSVTSMMMGLALEEGYIDSLSQPLADYISSWRGTDKDEITVDHMMTLRTAMETVNGTELYNAADQLKMSMDRPLIGTPGQRLYTYSNADVMLAGEIVLRSVGMNIDDYLQQKVAPIIGFTGEWWTDQQGHVLSYCCIDALPTDFARFGLLYARYGDWNGTQVVNREWVESSTEPAMNGTYSYYWWPLINGFGAFGLNSQIVAIYPDDDLVVLRFGQYTRVGDGTTARWPVNYHLTTAPQQFDNAAFLERVTDALR